MSILLEILLDNKILKALETSDKLFDRKLNKYSENSWNILI